MGQSLQRGSGAVGEPLHRRMGLGHGRAHLREGAVSRENGMWARVVSSLDSLWAVSSHSEAIPMITDRVMAMSPTVIPSPSGKASGMAPMSIRRAMPPHQT